MEKILLAKDVATWLSVDVQRIYELTRRNLLPHVKIGDRQYRYSETAVQRWLEQGGNRESQSATREIPFGGNDEI